MISNLIQPHLTAQKVRDTNENKRRNTVQSFLTPSTRRLSSRNSIAYTADEIVKTLQKFQENIAEKGNTPDIQTKSTKNMNIKEEMDNSEVLSNSDGSVNEFNDDEERKLEEFGEYNEEFLEENETRYLTTNNDDDQLTDSTKIVVSDFHKVSEKRVHSVRWSNDDDYAAIGCDDGKLLIYSKFRSLTVIKKKK